MTRNYRFDLAGQIPPCFPLPTRINQGRQAPASRLKIRIERTVCLRTVKEGCKGLGVSNGKQSRIIIAQKTG